MSLDLNNPLEIPLIADLAAFTVRVQLDGSEFRLGFDYSAREGRYYLSILDASGALIRAGIKVVTGAFLLRRIADPRRPKGDLYALPSTGGPPDLGDLGPGRRVALYYFPVLVPAPATVKVTVGG